MSEAKKAVGFTPGPWNIIHEDYVVDKDGMLVASVSPATRHYVTNSYHDSWNQDVADANGRLIAAAPDLLAFALEAKKQFDYLEDTNPFRVMMESAISKATNQI